jgi:antitoxin component YwqK of YwqJK toxin-antitoxin module
VIDWDQLEEQDHLKYFEGKPFTGIAVKKFENGQKNWERTFKEGKRHGLATGWYENGQKDDEATYKAGKLHGRYTEWYENGEKSEEGTYKDDQLISSKKFHEVHEETQKAAPAAVSGNPK